jgi:hypothetical protein
MARRKPLAAAKSKAKKVVGPKLGFTSDSKTLDEAEAKRPKFAPHVCPGTRYSGGSHGFFGPALVCVYCQLPAEPEHDYTKRIELTLADISPNDPRRHHKR